MSMPLASDSSNILDKSDPRSLITFLWIKRSFIFYGMLFGFVASAIGVYAKSVNDVSEKWETHSAVISSPYFGSEKDVKKFERFFLLLKKDDSLASVLKEAGIPDSNYTIQNLELSPPKDSIRINFSTHQTKSSEDLKKSILNGLNSYVDKTNSVLREKITSNLNRNASEDARLKELYDQQSQIVAKLLANIAGTRVEQLKIAAELLKRTNDSEGPIGRKDFFVLLSLFSGKDLERKALIEEYESNRANVKDLFDRRRIESEGRVNPFVEDSLSIYPNVEGKNLSFKTQARPRDSWVKYALIIVVSSFAASFAAILLARLIDVFNKNRSFFGALVSRK